METYTITIIEPKYVAVLNDGMKMSSNSLDSIKKCARKYGYTIKSIGLNPKYKGE